MTIKQARKKGENEEAPDGGTEGFPSARYFQVHFEHLEALLNETRSCLDALQRRVAEVHRGEDPAQAGSARGPRQTGSGLTLRADDIAGRPFRGNGAGTSQNGGPLEEL